MCARSGRGYCGPVAKDDFASTWANYLDTKKEVINAVMDAVFASHHDAPVPEVMSAMRPALAQLEIAIPDDALLPYAEAISGGDEVHFE